MNDTRSEREKKADATHEAGHALLQYRLCYIVDLCHNLITQQHAGWSESRGKTRSTSNYRPDDIDEIQHHIDGMCMALAGKVGERLIHGSEPNAWGTSDDGDWRKIIEHRDRLCTLRPDLDATGVVERVGELLVVWMDKPENRDVLVKIAEDVYTLRCLEADYFQRMGRVSYTPIMTVDDLMPDVS